MLRSVSANSGQGFLGCEGWGRPEALARPVLWEINEAYRVYRAGYLGRLGIAGVQAAAVVIICS